MTITWKVRRPLRQVDLWFDADFGRPLESVLIGHPERMMPFTLSGWSLPTRDGTVLGICSCQHLSRAFIILTQDVTNQLILEGGPSHGGGAAAVFAIRA